MTRPQSSPTISSLEKIPRRKEYLLALSDGTELKVLEDDLSLYGLAQGVVLPGDIAAQLRDRYEYARARAAALRLLKVRPRTEGELRRSLRGRAVEQPILERLLEDLKRGGHVDDRLFARLWATEKLRGGVTGRRRVVAELRARQVDPRTAEDETDSAYSSEEEIEAARQLAVRRVARMVGLTEDAKKRRLYEHLLRRGFESEVAAEATRFALRSSSTKGV
jgi:regulatory protein